MIEKILKFSLLCIAFLAVQCASPKEEEAGINNVVIVDSAIVSQEIINDSINAILAELNADEKVAKFHKYFRHLNKAGIFNGNVLVAQKGVIIYKECFGYADLRKRDSLHINSQFQIASVSKQFTAVAIMQLVEKGLISYTDTV